MELTQPQRDAVRDKLNAKFNDQDIPDCEMCGNDAWAIDPYILELREFAKGALFVGSPVLPLVSMHCTKCGNTKLFNAISLDVVDQSTGNIVGADSGKLTEAAAIHREEVAVTDAAK